MCDVHAKFVLKRLLTVSNPLNMEYLLIEIDTVISSNNLENKLINYWKAFIRMIAKRLKKQKRSIKSEDSHEALNEKKETFSPSSSGLHEINISHASLPSNNTQKQGNYQKIQPQYLQNLQYQFYMPVINVNNYSNYYMNSSPTFILGSSLSNNNIQGINQLNYYYPQPQNYLNTNNQGIQGINNFDQFNNNASIPSLSYYPEPIPTNHYITLPLSTVSRNISVQNSYRTENLNQLRCQHHNSKNSNFTNMNMRRNPKQNFNN